MYRLIPRDYWQYGFADLLKGGFASLASMRDLSGIDIPGVGRCIPSRSGRSALVSAIRALELPADAGIGVPLFCCPVVFQAIREAGCFPRFIDIEPTTFCMSPEDAGRKRGRLSAVVAVHMFGNVCNIPAITAATRRMPLIEDCAQAIGSTLGGQSVGTLGDIAFFSFRSGKYLSAGEGGAVFSRHERLMELLEMEASSKKPPTLLEECIHTVMTFVKSKLRRGLLYAAIGRLLWRAYNRDATSAGKQAEIAMGRVFRSDHATICRRLPGLMEQITRQRGNAEILEAALAVPLDALCAEQAGRLYNRFSFPITLPTSRHRELLCAFLLDRGIDTVKFLDGAVERAITQYGYNGDCPVAESLSSRVLLIPGYHSLSPRVLERIATSVNEGWAVLVENPRARVEEAQ